MSEQFQVGDLVRRVELYYDGVKVGCIYRVNHATPGSVDLDGLSDPGNEEYSPGRFELVYRPGEPDSWKPNVGDPVKYIGPDGFRRTPGHTYRVVTSDVMAFEGYVFISSDTGETQSTPRAWLGSVTPITTAQARRSPQ